MYLLLLYLPLYNFLIISLLGRFFGTRGTNIIVIFNMFLSTIISYFIFYEVVLNGSVCVFKIFSWLNIGLFNVYWGFFFDPITSVMLIVVNTISLLVHIYSIDYMKIDPFLPRFMAYLSLFTWFMLILVTSDNFLQLFLGWEGVGLVSYLLINFWFTIQEANKSAIKAIIINRIGDLGIILAMCLIFYQYKTLNFNVLFPLIKIFSDDYFYIFGNYYNSCTLITIFILIGAIGKSSQLGLHTWLPDAMAGPTPVSALIHAATMVTAGVFILIRVSPIIEYSNFGLFLIILIGALTSFFASSIGLFQNDLKKIIAYSTCSQLGYMIFICGLSNYSLSIFHLSNHAFFKALLFLSAGSIIHAMSDEQDIRKFGGLLKILPYSYIMFIIGSFALMGIPFLTGFYSKDLIIEITYSSYFFNSNFIYWLSILSALFTSLYSIRLIYFTFLTKPNGFKNSYKNSHDATFYMSISLLILSFNSIFFGYLNKDLFIGLGVDTWLNFIETTSTKNLLILESEFLPFYIKNIPFFFSLLGIILIFLLNYFFNFIYLKLKKNVKFFNFILNIYRLFSYKCYFDIIYNKIIVKYFFVLSYNNLKYIDRGLLELFGPLGLVRFINFLINKYNFVQTGFLYNYIFIFVLSLFFILFKFYFNIINFEFDYYFLIFFLFLLKRKKLLNKND